VSLYHELVQPIERLGIRRAVIGVNWTLVEAETGCGLAQTPRRDAPGFQPIASAGDLAKRDLRVTAELIHSANPMEAVLGMAAINAFYNRVGLSGSNENGLAAFSDANGPVTVVGRFPGLDRYIREYRVVEREPRAGEFSEGAFGDLMSDSTGVIITASTLVNKSAEAMFDRARGKRIAIVGPGTPLAPRLHALGVEVLAGSVVENADFAVTVVAQAGGAAALKPACRYVTLRAPRPLGELGPSPPAG
jgi:uncharacterized protein (DUF4213/DUF364 family)